MINKQYIWDQQYIDALVVRFYDADTDGSAVAHYATFDANMNLTAILDTSGNVVQRFSYDPYGQSHALDPDFTAYSGSDLNWRIRFQGTHYDAETGLHHVRNRMYHPTLGRWITRDPLGYPDGMNTYAGYFAMHGGMDPMGYSLLKPTLVVDESYTEQAIYDFALHGIRLAKMMGYYMQATGLDHWLHGGGADLWWRDNVFFRDEQLVKNRRAQMPGRWAESLSNTNKWFGSGAGGTVMKDVWDQEIKYSALKPEYIMKTPQAYVSGNYTIHQQGIFQCDPKNPNTYYGAVRAIAWDRYDFNAPMKGKGFQAIFPDPRNGSVVKLMDTAMLKLQKSGIGTDYFWFTAWVEKWKCTKDKKGYTCKMLQETGGYPVDRSTPDASTPPGVPDIEINGKVVDWKGWHIVSTYGNNLNAHPYFTKAGTYPWDLS